MPSKNRLYYLLAILVVFLALRYTRILFFTGIPELKKITGIPDSQWVNIVVIALFALSGYLLVSIDISRDSIQRFLRSNYFIHGTTLVMGLLMVVAAKYYKPYTDEVRDVTILNAVNTYGNTVYFQEVRKSNEIAREYVPVLHHTQYLHPPLQYLVGNALTKGKNTVWHYRIVFILILLVMLMVSWEVLRHLKIPAVYYLLAFTLLMSYSYLRNYEFIRVGIELFPFIGFSWFALLAGLYLQGAIRLSVPLVGSMVALLTLCMWSKFSFIVSYFAMFGAVFLFGLFKADRKAFIILSVMVLSLGVALLLYSLAYGGTHMIGEQAKYYLQLFTSKMPLIPDAGYDMTGYNTSSSSSIPQFLYRFVFWYGPVLTLGVGGFLLIFFRNRVAWKSFDGMVVVWVVLGFIGVLLVNPRSTYTSPFTIGLLYMAIRYLLTVFSEENLVRFSLLVLLFSITEIILIASSNAV